MTTLRRSQTLLRAHVARVSLPSLLVIAALVLPAVTASHAQAQVAGAIVVYPTVSSLEYTSTKQFSAYVPISPNTVTWLVNDVVGGNATIGTISPSGLYTPPTVIPAKNIVTIKAKSTAYPSSFGTASLTITKKYPWLWSVSPSTLPTGAYTVSFNGSNFAADSKALANGVALPTTFVSATKLVATGVAAQAGTIQFAVRQPAPGAVTGNKVAVQVTAITVSVAIAPALATVGLGKTQAFTATVTGNANTAVTWDVNGTTGGSASSGTITPAGVYTAPSAMPASTSVTVRATSMAAPSSSAQATVTLVVPVTVAVSPLSATVELGKTQAFTATVTGSSNTAVTWAVNGTTGGSPAAGTINVAGIYTAPTVMPTSSAVTIRATSVASPSSSAASSVTLSSPPPPAAFLTGARFLEQSSFGPTPATLAAVKQMGIPAYLDAQFAMPETLIPSPAGNSMGDLRQWMLHNYTVAPDQLRQRVAYALSQIVVTSGNKLVYANESLPWLRLLSQHAFGNYRDLLVNVIKSPSMGKYLDLANSMKPSASGGANENLPRELMQLFTIGLWQLNPDGSLAADANGFAIPSYTQQTVQQVALALTGWTYATAPGATPRSANWEYFESPMETRPERHDLSAKMFLGCTLAAGQTVEQDLDGVVDCLMNHANTAPFIATRLIRSLVTSNPSPGFIQRVANIFADNGSGVRGDLQAVVRAILTDAEARADIAPPTQGRLKEPILQIAGLLRALNGQFSSSHQLTYLFDYMAQSVLSPPSVFSWFSPLYRVPGNTLFGPEFQIYSPTEATLRGNFFHMVLTSSGGDTTVDLSPFQTYGNDMPGLVEAVNQVLLHGRMPDAMKQVLIAAAAPGYDAKTRIETVLYLTALSGQFAVQY